MTDPGDAAPPLPPRIDAIVPKTLSQLLREGAAIPERPAVCLTHGPFAQYAMTGDRDLGPWTPAECPKCTEDAEIAAARQAQLDALIEKRMAALAVPKQYARVELDTFDPTVLGRADPETQRLLTAKLHLARAFVTEYPDREEVEGFPVVCIFRGAPGTGKTMLAWSIAKALVRRYASTVVVATLADIVRDIRESWKRDAEGPSERARLRRYRDADLLVIDEVSRHALYGEPSQHLYDLIAPREGNLQPTILTTNEQGDDFEALIGEALTSRTAGAGGIWEFGVMDYRVARAETRRPFGLR